MLYFHVIDRVREVATNLTPEQYADPCWISRNDLETFAEAQQIAEQATALSGRPYVAGDDGPYCWPRYDVREGFAVGDAVSAAFNGDASPAGVVSRISPSGRVITTSTRGKFYRRRLTGAWVSNGAWCLVRGHVLRYNLEI